MSETEMTGQTVRLWIPALGRASLVTYTVLEHVEGGSYSIRCDQTGVRTFATAAAMVPAARD